MKFLTLALLLFVTTSILSQTTIESETILQINTIRKNPKSYIPVLENYIKQCEQGIVNIKMIQKADGVISNKSTEIMQNYEIGIAKSKKLISKLKTIDSMDTLKFNNDLYANHTSKLSTDAKFYSSESQDAKVIRIMGYINFGFNVTEVITIFNTGGDFLLKTILNSEELLSSDYTSVATRVGESVFILHLCANKLDVKMEEPKEKSPRVRDFFKRVFS
jgi:hypothetical protein